MVIIEGGRLWSYRLAKCIMTSMPIKVESSRYFNLCYGPSTHQTTSTNVHFVRV